MRAWNTNPLSLLAIYNRQTAVINYPRNGIVECLVYTGDKVLAEDGKITRSSVRMLECWIHEVIALSRVVQHAYPTTASESATKIYTRYDHCHHSTHNSLKIPARTTNRYHEPLPRTPILKTSQTPTKPEPTTHLAYLSQSPISQNPFNNRTTSHNLHERRQNSS